ncbi:MAG TPA: hypothetical protein VFE38_08935 [Edaphobacter sp.]|nr:hypothetical protein [Edaphobacter sp.]
MKRRWAILILMAVLLPSAGAVRAHAAAAVLMEEPYGLFGGVNPTGHVAIYLNRVCAETPTRLRMCHPGEKGVVISRYNDVGGYDWLAIPLVPYLYAVEDVDDVPATANEALVEQLRDQYRRKHLEQIAPDVIMKTADGETLREMPEGNWVQLVGESYNRRIYGFEIETSQEADERFVAEYNDKHNVSHFNLIFRNCADFSRNLLNFYYPHSVGRNFLVDFGITTPKQVARSVTKYAKRHPELEFSTFVIPQVPGTIGRSHRTDGVLESMLRSKKYVVPLAVLNPHVTAGMIVAYLVDGRFSPPKTATEEMLPPVALPQPALAETTDSNPTTANTPQVQAQPVSVDPQQPDQPYRRSIGAAQ